MDSFIPNFQNLEDLSRRMESLTVDDWIDVDSIDDIGFAKLRGWNLASLPELVCAAVCGENGGARKAL